MVFSPSLSFLERQADMKLNFTTLQYFQKTAELEHLTKAAEELHIAQPALSRTIRGLEQELEVTLFEHQGRNIRLTRDGHILLKHAQNFLKEFDEMQQEFKDSRDLAQSTVKLAILSATKMIPNFLMQFKKEHPTAILEILRPDSQQAAAKLDLSLYADLSMIDNDHTVSLFRESLVMILPKNDRHADLPYVSLSDYAEANFIAAPKGFMLRGALEAFCKKAGFTPQVVMESDNPDTVRDFVRAGLGVALVPQMTWYSAQEGVASLPVGDQECYRYLYLSWKTDAKLPLSAVLLREYIIDHFWEYVRFTANSTYPME